MGNFIWHDWARFVSLASSVYAVWAAYWGLFYRKFFWDFVDGTLRNPGGLQPGPSAIPFVAVIVKLPIVQIVSFFLGALLICIERPLPVLKNSALHRSFVPKIVLLILQAFLTALYYQGTNASLWSLIAVIAYTMAQMKGEVMKDNSAPKGRGQSGKV